VWITRHSSRRYPPRLARFVPGNRLARSSGRGSICAISVKSPSSPRCHRDRNCRRAGPRRREPVHSGKVNFAVCALLLTTCPKSFVAGATADLWHPELRQPQCAARAHPWLHSGARKGVPLCQPFRARDATCPAHGLAAHLAAMERIVPRHCPFEKIPGRFFWRVPSGSGGALRPRQYRSGIDGRRP
jgi:hypothetical protein